MNTATYQHRRGEIQHYFDRTAAQTWARLTSDAPVGRIRATVRAGRDEMRARMLACLPDDLRGARILDAGCGTGLCVAFLKPLAAHLVGVDLSGSMLKQASRRGR